MTCPWCDQERHEKAEEYNKELEIEILHDIFNIADVYTVAFQIEYDEVIFLYIFIVCPIIVYIYHI